MSDDDMEDFATWDDANILFVLDELKYLPGTAKATLRVNYVRGLINEIMRLRGISGSGGDNRT